MISNVDYSTAVAAAAAFAARGDYDGDGAAAALPTKSAAAALPNDATMKWLTVAVSAAVDIVVQLERGPVEPNKNEDEQIWETKSNGW